MAAVRQGRDEEVLPCLGSNRKPDTDRLGQAFEERRRAPQRPDLASMISEHAPPGSCKFNGALSSVGPERLPYKPQRGDRNPGKKSSKSNQDCTICLSLP